jgi:hypothetical protein
VLLALVVGGVAFAAVVLLGGSSHPGVGSGGGTSGSVVHLQGVGDYDPQGDGGELSSTAPQATDGNTATAWQTETYATPEFGNLKDGLGLVLRAGSSVKLATLTVQTPTPGFVARVEVGNSPNGPFQVDSLTKSVGSHTTFTLDGKSGQYWVVWLTQLPPQGRAEISEVSAKS